MNPLALESNVVRSLKKYFVDALGTAVTFDISLASPSLRTQGSEAITKWYNVFFGGFGRNALADYTFHVFCLTRGDPEGVELTVAADTIMGMLVDSNQSDGKKRIPLYDTSESPWTLLTNMVVQEIWDDASLLSVDKDETKIRSFAVLLRWGLKI